MSSAAPPLVRTRARVCGTVQGVGFRPFAYRLAHEERLAGYVLNDEHGVLLEVQGPADAVQRFLRRLRAEAPPLAAIDSVECEAIALAVGSGSGDGGFTIIDSRRSGSADALVTADAATCPDCLAELGDPADRRFRYPFINCTNCGPRFTIVRDVPYDRPQTTMASFVMCADCRREYEDPLDRRFHAQPNACPRCGPSVQALYADGSPVQTVDPIAWAAQRLAAGAIAAVKGLGGFHLACDAADERAVAALRARKHRDDKPFALMAPDLDAAATLVSLDPGTRALLTSPARPIVLAPRRHRTPVAAAVAPAASELGVMLPYSPLHHLLLGDCGRALVMTSGNLSDEPIAFRDDDALRRLRVIADLFLVHDRLIETRTDDSVVRSRRGMRSLMLRRSRGYVPAPLKLPVASPRPLLACGAQQKNTFCVARGDRAWVSHHVGDLEHAATLRAFREGIEHFERLFAVVPDVVVHDLHPQYLSTQYALERDGVKLVAVQHHHAHLAAGLAEHGVTAPAVGAIFDGTGYGEDGTIWGGELLVGDLQGFERAGWLWPVRMPGGTAAIRQPWRMAAAWLAAAHGEPQPVPDYLRDRVSARRWDAIAAIGASAAVSPLTSSIGRLFDAVGALCGTAAEVSYEGQAAVELETLAWAAPGRRRDAGYEIPLLDGCVLDPRGAVRSVCAELESGVDAASVAAAFHVAVADATIAALTRLAGARGLDTVVLAGGVFQNRLLLESVARGAIDAGLRVLVPERLPPNDGAISYGQAAIAAARWRGLSDWV
ncbi:MAG TPA: carbamoyltransferase HypF [Solirubrobacteraceae bacterium]|nr:carbamoyltransferase HypF [Solirubrobacteraceae bacterium]